MSEFLAAKEAQGPPPISLWALLRGHRSDPLERWTHLRQTYGDVARFRYGLTDSYFISSAEGAKHVLQDRADNYTKDHPSYKALRQLFGNGLLTSQGEHWLRQRRLAQPAFHRQRIAAMAEQMVHAAEDAARRWEAADAPVSLVSEMSRLTLDIAGRALFGTGLAAEATEATQVAHAWSVLSEQMNERFSARRLIPPILPTRYDYAFRRARRTLFSVVDAIIAERRRHRTAGDDLLSMLMHATDEETGTGMSDRQLRDELITMLVGGHDTTAIALTWTWAFLAAHPRVAQALHDELDTVLHGRSVHPDDVARLPYTRAVINEALRLCPPAYIILRHVRADDVICGYRIHAGGSVILSPVILHRHPDYWDRPDDFVPERWLDEGAVKDRPRFAYVPFSGGPRQCIGNAFSLMEATVVLATLARRFAPRLVEEGLPGVEYAVLARPKGAMFAWITARSGGGAGRQSQEVPARLRVLRAHPRET